MSVKLMTAVWESGLYSGSRLLVLLGVADRADDDGGNAYPGVADLMWKSRLDRRQVQRILRQLEHDGVVTANENAVGGRGLATVYQINVEFLAAAAAEHAASRPRKGGPGVALSRPKKGGPGVALFSERATSERIKGDIAMSPQRPTTEFGIAKAIPRAADAPRGPAMPMTNQLGEIEPTDGDWAKSLFREGLGYLASTTGTDPDRLRPLIGRWLKSAQATGLSPSQAHRRVFGLLALAQAESIADPRAWVSAAVTKPVDAEPSGFAEVYRKWRMTP